MRGAMSYVPTIKIGRSQTALWVIVGAVPTVKCETYETAMVVAETIRAGAMDTGVPLYSYWSTP